MDNFQMPLKQLRTLISILYVSAGLVAFLAPDYIGGADLFVSGLLCGWRVGESWVSWSKREREARAGVKRVRNVEENKCKTQYIHIIYIMYVVLEALIIIMFDMMENQGAKEVYLEVEAIGRKMMNYLISKDNFEEHGGGPNH